MPRKQNRGYKKKPPFRDHRKFVIIAEGEREDNYFIYFNNINSRIKVAIVPREGGKSACKYFIERLNDYEGKEGLETDDLIWFVMDVDNWKRQEIDLLYQHCKETKNRHIAISNPSFEVWLYFHFGNPAEIKPQTARTLKTKLNTLVHGGISGEQYAKEIKRATTNAEAVDKNASHYYPDIMTTKVYQLAKQMLLFLGNNWMTQ